VIETRLAKNGVIRSADRHKPYAERRTGQDRDANWLLVLTRLKIRKLQLKDHIARIEDALLPDILRRRESSP